MDIRNILLLIWFLLSLLLAFIVYKNNPRRETNVSYGLLALWAALWSLGIAIFRFSEDYYTLLFWNREFILTAALVASSFLHFSFVLSETGTEKKLKHLQRFLIYFPNLIILWGVLTPGVLIADIKIRDWGNESILGWGYIYYGIYFGFIWTWGTFNLIKKYIRAIGIFKTQLKYILTGLTISVIIGATFNLVFILLGNYQWIWLGPYALFVFVLTSSYAIIRYRLMDIRLVFGRGAIYVFSFATVIVSAFFLMFLNNQLAQPLPLNISGSLIIIISILLFQPIFRFFEKLASKYFYYTFYSYQTVLADLGRNLSRVLDLDKLSSLIVNTLIETMKLDKTVILLRDPETGNYQIKKNIGFREENGISFVKDDFLTQYLEKTQKPLVYEELSLIIRDTTKKEEKEKLGNLQANMKRIEAALCLPLLIEDKIIGLIVLGNKVSGEPYSIQDIELLINLSIQSSIGLQNARLYSQVEDLSQNLQQRVKEQTQKIQALLEMKSEFLKVVTHQLNTPASIIKGMLSMMAEGSVKGERLEEFTKKAYLSAERLTTILDDILVAQSLVAGSETVKLSPCQIEEIVEKKVIHLKPQAEMKNLKLLFEKLKKPLPITLADSEMLERAVFKLIDNAILYTEKGEIKVSLNLKKKENKDFIEISVKDSGIGLDEEDKNNLFKLFFRGKKATGLHTNGTGLGLFIVKEFVGMNKGEVNIESEGRGRGSRFTITLPVITEM